MRKSIIASILAAGSAALAVATAGAQTVNPPWIMPIEAAAPTQDAWNDFAYQSLIALNWPATGTYRGEPDADKKLGAVGSDGQLLPTVWQTYRTRADIFLQDGVSPAPWNSSPGGPSCGDGTSPIFWETPAKPSGVLKASKYGDHAFGSDLNQAGFPYPTSQGIEGLRGALTDQRGYYVRYDVMMNQAEFNYLLRTGYYGSAKQAADNKANRFNSTFPTDNNSPDVKGLPRYAQQGVVEIKASWRRLGPGDDKKRYYNMQAYTLDGAGTCQGPFAFGLVGFHILRLTPSTKTTWFWATFEQVDNILGSPPSFNPEAAPPTEFVGGFRVGDSYANRPEYIDPSTTPVEPAPKDKIVNVSRVTPIPDYAKKAAQKWASSLAGTVWANYELIGTQNPATPDQTSNCWTPNQAGDRGFGTLNDCNLANTTAETFVQATSCVTCHAYAASICDPGSESATKFSAGYPTNQIFTFMLDYAQPPVTSCN